MNGSSSMGRTLLISLWLGLLAVGCSAPGPSQAVSGGNETQAAAIPGRVGQPVNARGVSITVQSTESSQGTAEQKPEAGKVFLLVHLTIQNTSPTGELEVSGGDFDLMDSGGTRTSFRSLDFLTDELEDRTLAPSEKAAGTVGFELDPLKSGLHLLYDYNDQHIDVDLGK